MISFLGVRTDRQDFGILIWKHVGTQKFQLKIRELTVDRNMHLRKMGMHNKIKYFLASQQP